MLFHTNAIPFRKQIGSAIIVALFVVALVAAAAIAMITRIQQDTRRAELILNSNQAYFYAQGSIAWAMDQLINDWKNQQPQQVIDKTPITSPSKKMDNATITSTIYDAQGLFNLNNLADASYRENFMRLIKAVSPKTNTKDIQNIIVATVDWIASNGKPGSLDEYYSKQVPAYRSPHQLMTSPSELRLVKGMTAELFSLLSPFVTALPTTTQININNAPLPVLMSLSPSLNLDSAKAIDAFRKQKPFAPLQNFLNFDVVKNNSFKENQTTITSQYFLVKTNINIGDQNITLYTLMLREIKNSRAVVTLLWQSKGTL